jgi:hypothetical protein
MTLPPDPPTPAKPKLTPEERRARQADRLASIRLRMAIGHELDERGITTPAAIGEALGMPAPEATKLLTERQWREGDVAAGCGGAAGGAGARPMTKPRRDISGGVYAAPWATGT